MGRRINDSGYPQPVSDRSGEVPVDQIGRLPALIGAAGSAHGSVGEDVQQAYAAANEIGGLMRLYEREDPGGVSVSQANQATAFARISLSILSCLFARRRRCSSARSSVVRPSVRLP